MARKLEVQIVGDASSFQRALGQASSAGGGFGSKMKKVGKLAAIGIGIAGAAAGAAGVKMIGLASDAEEVESKFKVIFGRTVPKLTRQINAFARATGASRFELKEQVADLGALLKPIIKNTQETGKMSLAVAQLATDLGSFNNVPVEEALIAIRAGLVGEAEPLRRFGVLLNAAAVEAEGLRMGLIKQGETMTEQEKVQARYSLIMKQTKLAQGDAERTAGSFANQLKRLKNGVKDAGTSVGKFLLPVATSVIGAFNDAAPAIQGFLDKLGKATTFKAKFKIVWTSGKGAALDLIETIREELFGELIRKPLKLKSGKIIDWEEDRQTGLIKSIEQSLRNADWTAIGQKVGQGISSRVRITADFLGNLLSTMNEFIDSHLDEFANTGAKLLLAVISKLMDPAFWKENWQLVLGVAVAVFPLGRMFTLGGKIAGAILGVIGKLLPAGFKAIGGTVVQVLATQFGRLPGLVQTAFKAVVSAAKAILSTLISWLKNTFKAALDKIPGWVKAAFRLGFVMAFVNAIKDAWNWLKKITGKIWKVTIKVDAPSLPGWADPRNLLRPDRQAMGTNFARGGPTIVGERGPELVNLPRGSQVIPNHRLGRAGGGGAVRVIVVGGDRDAIEYLQSLDTTYRRGNGGRGIWR